MKNDSFYIFKSAKSVISMVFSLGESSHPIYAAIFAKSAEFRHLFMVFRLGESGQDRWPDSPSLKTMEK